MITAIAILITALLTASATWLIMTLRNKPNTDKVQGWLMDEGNPELTEVWQDPDNGRRWYTFANPMSMPAIRAFSLDIATKQAEMNVTPTSLREYTAEMRKQANKGDIVGLFTLLDRLDERTTWAMEEETITNLALVYFVVEGENIKSPSAADNEYKRGVLKTNQDARAFFLPVSCRLMGITNDIANTAILTYLTQKEGEKKSHFKNKLPSTLQNTSTGSTNKTISSAGKTSPQKKPS